MYHNSYLGSTSMINDTGSGIRKMDNKIEEWENDDQLIELHRAGKLQRSPETTRNIQSFVTNFEDVNLEEDFEPEGKCDVEQRISKLNKSYNTSTFSIDSWSINSTITEKFDGFEDTGRLRDWMPASYKKTIVICFTTLASAIIVVTVFGASHVKQMTNQQLPRIG